MKRTLITSALPYANGYLHLGHCAGAYLPADIYARFKRLKGEEVLYVCGSDEHGVAITIAAEKEGVSPQEIIDKYHFANKEAFDKFGMSFDIYSRTSIPLHHNTAREFFRDFKEKGYLIDMEEEQFYDNDAGMFLPDRYVEGICPNCGNEHARGDQCDSCGAYYNQLELKNPVSLVSGKTPVVRRTVHWYMRFDKFQTFLENYIESHSKDWKDNVLQQSRSWLKQGLAERAITRDLTWGVKIDDLPDVPPEKAKGKVLYVWFEAVLGYISATKELMGILNKEGKAGADDWQKWWKDEETRYIAFIGKDNIVFHTLIFPAILHGRGGNYILPDNVPANEFLNLEGQKFSKSRNWSIDLRDFINNFPEPSGVDALRYTLAMNLPETKDSDFTWKDFQARNNNELSAIFGNFVNRTLQFALKNFEGIPELPDKYKWLNLYWKNLIHYFDSDHQTEHELVANVPEELRKLLNDNDVNLIYALWNNSSEAANLYERFRFRDGVSETMNIARAANKYFNDEQPWSVIKNEPDEAAKTIYICCQLVRSLAQLFAPLIPYTSKRIFEILNLKPITGESTKGVIKYPDYWKDAVIPVEIAGKKFGSPEILFPKIEDDVVNAQTSKLGLMLETKENENMVPLITIDDFTKIQLRTAKILKAEKVPKSKKLLRLQVDTGIDQRQIIAGIAEHYEPDYLIGKTVIIVANLQPAKLMGEESNGMMLAASDSTGKLRFLTTEIDDLSAGSNIK
ncbi:MAG: methionine--tRNA ligase [Ignavibacteriae bacterium]|nr:methionine--tRNA ligase [Ignavibacteriota bacterium]